jgi:hypothetical protein
LNKNSKKTKGYPWFLVPVNLLTLKHKCSKKGNCEFSEAVRDYITLEAQKVYEELEADKKLIKGSIRSLSGKIYMLE